MKRSYICPSTCLLSILVFGTAYADEQSKQNPEPEVIEQSTFRPVLPAKPAAAFAPDEKIKPVQVKIFPMFSKLPRGGKCPVAVELEIKQGWHINANPASPDFLVPTKLQVKTKQKIKLSKVKYPTAHPLLVKGSSEPYHVYDGMVRVYGLLDIDDKETAEFAELEFHIDFQGCNQDQCLPPDKIVMKGKLKFALPGEELKKINEDKFPKPKPKNKKTPEKAPNS